MAFFGVPDSHFRSKAMYAFIDCFQENGKRYIKVNNVAHRVLDGTVTHLDDESIINIGGVQTANY